MLESNLSISIKIINHKIYSDPAYTNYTNYNYKPYLQEIIPAVVCELPVYSTQTQLYL